MSDAVTILNKPCSQLTSQDFSSCSSNDLKLDAVIGEPYFSSSLLPWHNLHYWYAVCALKKFMTPDCVIVPGVIHLKAIAGDLITWEVFQSLMRAIAGSGP